MLQLAEHYEIIQKTIRNFAQHKTLCFVSLKLDVISYETILWALQSLKRDEMTPTEKAVQNRIKEAFALKVNNGVWKHLLSTIDSGVIQSSPCPFFSKSVKAQILKTHEKLDFHEADLSFAKSVANPLKFITHENTKNSSGFIKGIYFAKQPAWESVDNFQTHVSIDQGLYDVMIAYLRQYFEQGAEQEEFKKE